MTTTAPPSVADLVDTACYPLSSPGSPEWTAAVAMAREELRDRGCCVLPGFLQPSVVEVLRRECASVTPAAHYDVETVNVSNTMPDRSLPLGHPVRTKMSAATPSSRATCCRRT